MQVRHPVSASDAITFAKLEFQRGTRFWPRLIIAHAEEKSPLGAIRFALKTYEAIASQRENDYVTRLVLELNDILNNEDPMDGGSLQRRSEEIWADSEDKSFLKRGAARLFNTVCYYIQGQSDDYEIEATRALGMGILAEDGSLSVRDFGLIVSTFLSRYTVNERNSG